MRGWGWGTPGRRFQRLVAPKRISTGATIFPLPTRVGICSVLIAPWLTRPLRPRGQMPIQGVRCLPQLSAPIRLLVLHGFSTIAALLTGTSVVIGASATNARPVRSGTPQRTPATARKLALQNPPSRLERSTPLAVVIASALMAAPTLAAARALLSRLTAFRVPRAPCLGIQPASAPPVILHRLSL